MANSDGGFSLAATGVVTVNLGYQPDHLRFTAGPRGNSSTKIQVYTGSVDSSGYEGCFGQFSDGTNVENTQKTSDTKCIYIREYVSGAWVTRVDATFHSYVANGFKLTVTTADSGFPLWVESSN